MALVLHIDGDEVAQLNAFLRSALEQSQCLLGHHSEMLPTSQADVLFAKFFHDLKRNDAVQDQGYQVKTS